MIQSYENVELKNLPFNHSLFERQKILFERDYKLS